MELEHCKECGTIYGEKCECPKPAVDKPSGEERSKRFDCGGEIIAVDAEDGTVTIKPMISVSGLKIGDHCNLILYKHF